MLKDLIASNEKFYLYGAQVVSYGASVAIQHLWNRKPEAFLVSNRSGNPVAMDGIITEKPENVSRDSLIIVAVTELLQGEIVRYLAKMGFKNLFLLTHHEEHLLMSAYFESLGRFPAAQETDNMFTHDFAMYEVRNHRDKPLSSRPPLLNFEHTIQAGAAITMERIASILDNTGENISKRNRQYCEMTATYWVWKNAHHDWVGIEHYRRHLLVKPGMLSTDVDAILPLPYVCYPDTLAQFRRFVSEDVLQALLKALEVLHHEEYDKYLSILKGPYQYTYNLVCARATVFDDYCTWFFRITKYMEGMTNQFPEIGSTRALSYVAEVLTNLYFMSHQDVWKIRHAEKAIYV